MNSSPQRSTPNDPGSVSTAPDPVLTEGPVRSERGGRGREFPGGLALVAFILAELACVVFLVTTI